MIGLNLRSTTQALVSQSSKNSFWSLAVNRFKTKITGDGGTLENYNCILTDVKSLMQSP